jgi:hypothetical protein
MCFLKGESVMALNLLTLLVLLLPGFWSAWVYWKISRDDKQETNEWSTVALGFSFGIVNLGIFTMGNLALQYLFQIPRVLFDIGDDLSWLSEWQFWVSFFIIAVIAHIIGYLAGLLRLAGKIPALMLAKKASQRTGGNIGTGYKSSLKFIVEKEIPKYCITRIYKLGEESKPIVGLYKGTSGDEIQLCGKPLFREFEDYRMEDPCVTYFNINSNIAIDFVTTESETQKHHLQKLNEKYYSKPASD